jgi:chromosome segregation ATPase
MELLRGRIAELENKLIESETVAVNKISSNKSDDGWCLNGDELNLETVEKKADTSENEKQLQALLNEKDEEIANLENQVELFSNELEQANGLILRLKNLKQNSPDVSPKPSNDELSRKAHEIKELKQEINDLVSKNDTLAKQLDELNETIKNERAKHDLDAEDKEKRIDSLNLDLKQLQQSIQQEKMLQLQENKKEKHEISHLKTENAELKVKLDEKLGEIKLLGDQINELNHNINSLKSTDSSLFAELQNKTEQFVTQIDDANKEIALLKSDKEKLNEQRKQLEFLCEEKVRENSQLKNDIQTHIQHISAQSKAIEKLQADLKELESSSSSSSSTKVKSDEEEENNKPDQSEELNLMREQYNQVYTYLEQKNQESLSYYNEIQRLNQVVSDLNRELLNTKTVNENLNEQYDHLVKEFQLEQKMVDDINQQTFELNKTLISTSNVVAEAVALQNQKQEAEMGDESLLVTKEKIKQEIEEDIVKREKEKSAQLEENNRQVIEQMEYQIKALMGEREQIVQASRQCNEEMGRKLNETVNQYESIIRSQNENFKNNLLSEEQQQQRMSKELERLREHLVEMSDSYNREAVEAEEREKQLRLALSKAEEKCQQQGANLETSRYVKAVFIIGVTFPKEKNLTSTKNEDFFEISSYK